MPRITWHLRGTKKHPFQQLVLERAFFPPELAKSSLNKLVK